MLSWQLVHTPYVYGPVLLFCSNYSVQLIESLQTCLHAQLATGSHTLCIWTCATLEHNTGLHAHVQHALTHFQIYRCIAFNLAAQGDTDYILDYLPYWNWTFVFLYQCSAPLALKNNSLSHLYKYIEFSLGKWTNAQGTGNYMWCTKEHPPRYR